MYRELFLLPTENLMVGLGDTRKLSVSNGLEGRGRQGVADAWGARKPIQGPGTEGRWRPCPGSRGKPGDPVHILNFLNRLSEAKGQ